MNTKVAPFETDVFRTTNNELYVYFQTDHFQVLSAAVRFSSMPCVTTP